MFGLSDDATSKLAVALITAILGGVVVAIFNWLVNRKKTAAEIVKLRLESEKLSKDLQGINQSIQEVSAKISQNERVIYDGTKEMSGFDFKGVGERYFGEDNSRPIGEGNLTVSDNVLQILRGNTGGRYRVILQRYFYDSKELEYIPKNPSLSNKRKLKISCQARTTNGTHDLLFTLKRRDDGAVFERTETTRVTKEWRNLIHFVRVDAIDDVLLWIDDQGVTIPDTVLYIRNLSFTETLN
jgi:hypothetical protein